MSANADVFAYKRNPKPAGVLTTEDSILVIGSGDSVSRAYLVQNWQITYQQQVEELFELGSNRVYWKKGRPVGQGNLGRICGAGTGSAVTSMFPKEALDACNGGATMAVKVGGGSCSGVTALTFTLAGVLIAQLGYTSQVQEDSQVNENVVYRFSQLQVE